MQHQEISQISKSKDAEARRRHQRYMYLKRNRGACNKAKVTERILVIEEKNESSNTSDSSVDVKSGYSCKPSEAGKDQMRRHKNKVLRLELPAKK